MSDFLKKSNEVADKITKRLTNYTSMSSKSESVNRLAVQNMIISLIYYFTLNFSHAIAVMRITNIELNSHHHAKYMLNFIERQYHELANSLKTQLEAVSKLVSATGSPQAIDSIQLQAIELQEAADVASLIKFEIQLNYSHLKNTYALLDATQYLPRDRDYHSKAVIMSNMNGFDQFITIFKGHATASIPNANIGTIGGDEFNTSFEAFENNYKKRLADPINYSDEDKE